MFSCYPSHVKGSDQPSFDPLSAAEISVAVATVRAAGATPEVIIYAFPLFLNPFVK